MREVYKVSRKNVLSLIFFFYLNYSYQNNNRCESYSAYQNNNFDKYFVSSFCFPIFAT